VLAVAVSPLDDQMAAGFKDGNVTIYEFSTGIVKFKLESKCSAVQHHYYFY
jgi:hypothetical protein